MMKWQKNHGEMGREGERRCEQEDIEKKRKRRRQMKKQPSRICVRHSPHRLRGTTRWLSCLSLNLFPFRRSHLPALKFYFFAVIAAFACFVFWFVLSAWHGDFHILFSSLSSFVLLLLVDCRGVSAWITIMYGHSCM